MVRGIKIQQAVWFSQNSKEKKKKRERERERERIAVPSINITYFFEEIFLLIAFYDVNENSGYR